MCGEAAPDLDLSLPAVNPALAVPQKGPPREISIEQASPEPLPIAITPGEAGASARASLQTLRDYNAQISVRKLSAARARAPDALPVPKGAIAAKPALDVWSSVEAQGFDGEEGRTVKTGAGLDYRIVPNTSVGVVAERAGAPAAANEAASGDDEKVAAYVAFKALPAVTIDARTQWERASVPAGGEEADAKGTGMAERSSIIVAPRLDKSFVLEDGQTLAPYVQVKRELDLSGMPAGDAALPVADSAGAGVTLAKPGSYALSVTTDVTGLGGAEAANVNGKLQMKVPLD